jgi:hypothetical protein
MNLYGMREDKTTSAAWMNRLGIGIGIVLFLVGIWSVPLAIFGPDRALIPGDLGDARFNNYILEHAHRYITGKEDAFWDAPFMYPWKNVIALSDNLMGSAPIYSAFRVLGLSREGAFQGWLLVLFALNYWCCLLALRKWAGSTALAACAAYIVAFGIYNIGQINNLQVMPRFMAPLALLFLWNHLQTGAWKWVLWAMLAVVYQFYCGIYMGFILVYGLFFLFLGHLVAFRKPSFLQRFREKRFALRWLATMVAGLLLLAPMMLHYMAVPGDLGTRKFSDIVASIPRPTSYFFTHPAAISWRSLSGLGVDAFPQWWSHFHFIGALPWLTLLAVPFLLRSKRIALPEKHLLAGMAAALVLSILFCLNLDGFSLYRLVFMLPGFSVLRAIDRYINVQVLFFLILFVLVLRPLFQRRRTAWALSLLLPVLAVQDNRWDVGQLKRFDKFRSRKLVEETERRITRSYLGDGSHDAIAYEPLHAITSNAEVRHTSMVNTQVTAMLAGQELGLRVVNAYTGGYPGNYIAFFSNMDHRTLADWCAYNGIGTDRIQEIDGLAVPITGLDTVRLLAANGRYVCADVSKDGLVRANREKAYDWETFLQLHTADGRVAFLAANDQFLCAELEQRQQLAATGKDLGDFGLFSMETLDSGMVALRAFNGRYVMLDGNTGELQATGEGISPEARFRLMRPEEGG